MPALLSPNMMAEMKAGCEHGHDILVHSPSVGRTLANPVLLRVMADYMGIEELHFGTLPWPAVHQPNDDPENMKQPSGGWHSCVLQPSHSRFLRLSHSRFLWLD